MTWSDLELQRLSVFKEKWSADPTVTRDAMSERVYNSLYRAKRPKTSEEKNDLWLSVTSWAWVNDPNRQKPPERKEEDQGQKQWNWRTVTYEECRDVVQDMIDKRFPELKKPEEGASDDPERQSKRFKMLQPILSEVIKGLTPDQVTAAKDKAERWNNQGPPPATQAQLAKAKLGSTLRSFAQHVRKQFGVAVVFVTAHKDENGVIMTGVHEWNKKNFGLSFVDTCPNKTTVAIDNLIDAFAEELFDDGKMKERENIRNLRTTGLPVDVDGRPRIPDPPPGGWTHLELQVIIRLYYKGLYRWAGAKFKASPPWADMGTRPNDFFEGEFILEGFKFKDPSHISVKNARKLVNFILDRQRDPDIQVAMQFKSFQSGRGESKELHTARNGKTIEDEEVVKGQKKRKKKNQAKEEDIWSGLSSEESDESVGDTEEEQDSDGENTPIDAMEKPVVPKKQVNSSKNKEPVVTKKAPKGKGKKKDTNTDTEDQTVGVLQPSKGKGKKKVQIQEPKKDMPQKDATAVPVGTERPPSPMGSDTEEDWVEKMKRIRAKEGQNPGIDSDIAIATTEPVQPKGKGKKKKGQSKDLDKENATSDPIIPPRPLPRPRKKETKGPEDEDRLFMREPSIRPGPSQNSMGFKQSLKANETGQGNLVEGSESVPVNVKSIKGKSAEPKTVPAKRKASDNQEPEEEKSNAKRSTSGRSVKAPKRADGTFAAFAKPKSRGN